ncbi:UDP-glucose 4-epimerase [Leptolyngbya boryana NIES-2135]|jgi:UDP-glucose 4-epimerase|uniref:UDP-glucose 4-epimerase n=1 Tax=Leptolyngbya boryana NIES-2135 TaxID=1973484 RepID=A0A1Z4JIU8_LEPBY|nr:MULTISPECIES: NAD-dependent epimerase/dehydratase family protein [Leptolyngbya]BAY56695.1 UDP-glucose 4-epimerase [Leptolyngbya boryana NIES-2135]MBD2369468.1 NAD-dependent epimerase/dehydratase family protein [Leptolyngbya sp. FACHB-161]MBD2376787.1 NAD-dependent epimerase/dehydratase family protein [Leptolyngbya sp. FACHB-238]MBD2401154.1 NAD-dependent epimerase/dehydratase family protein [Leptolyngbya sp. FACHB-239]MBD2407705.1 NAD-dependent epimerase/dehydratase family protein [Leptolyn
MRFIVTGGAGFIGSHVTEELLTQGHSAIVVDNLMTGSLKNLSSHPQLSVLQKDILRCQPIDFSGKIDGLVHLAATPSVMDSWLHSTQSHHNNLSSIIAVINLCQALSIPKLVFASSAAVYGNLSATSISEEHAIAPISPYGLQKLASEQYGRLFAERCGFSFVGLRLFNVFGDRQAPHSSYSGVISQFIQAMQQGVPLTVYGDGTQTRDFVYVKDVAQAFVQALQAPLAPGSSLVCNIGTGKATSLLQLIDWLRLSFPNYQAGMQFAAARPGDIQYSQAEIMLARTALNFHPQWSTKQGLRSLLHSFDFASIAA